MKHLEKAERWTLALALGVHPEAVEMAKKLYDLFPSDWSVFIHTAEDAIDTPEIYMVDGNDMNITITK